MGEAYSSAEMLPPAVADATLRWMLSVADTKHRIGMQFSHWVTGTPALEAAVGAAAMTQDELGHARSLYGLLRHFPDAPAGIGAENDLEARDLYYAPATLSPRWESWLQLVAVSVVLDGALSCAIAALTDSAFTPLAGRVGKILQEERYHRIFGEQWLARLLQDVTVRPKVLAAVAWAWAIADVWIGPDDDAVTRSLAAAGVLSGTSAEIRTNWRATVAPIVENHGLALPPINREWARWARRIRHNHT